MEMEGAAPRPLESDDHVDDQELLYHAVREKHFIRHSETDITVSENAYYDSRKQPSVDRAQLNDSEPQRTRFRESDAIVSLVTADVRGIESIIQPTAGG